MSKLASETSSEAAAFAEQFAAGWRTGGPIERFVAHFAPLCQPDALFLQPLGPAVRGEEGLRQLFGALFEAMPDLRGEVLRWGPTDDGLIIELTLRGTLGGRPIAWTVVDRVVLRDGLLAERQTYFDPTPLLPTMLRSPREALSLMRGMRKRKEHR